MSDTFDSEIEGILSEFLAEENREEVKQPQNEEVTGEAPEEERKVISVPVSQEFPEEEEVSTQRTYRPKRIDPAKKLLHRLMGIAGAVLSALLLGWVAVNVHPSSGTGSGTASTERSSYDSVSVMEQKLNNSKSDALQGVTYIPKIYKIPENAAAAPAPNPYAFKTVSNEEASRIEGILLQARDSGLLEDDEVMAFSSNAEFYHGADIQYYLDDTILAICWKEVINGNTCSFLEVKVADASQFRRKFIDDTFAPDVQDYATNIARSVNAVAAVNADFYAFRDFGIVVYQRKLYRFNEEPSYIQDTQKYNCVDTLFVDENGDFRFFHRTEVATREEMEQYIKDNNILFSVSFGPVLVENGQLVECTWYPVGEVFSGYSRAGIGQMGQRHYLYMSLNHSNEQAARWDVNEFGRHFYEKGVVNAYNLDGGQTAELVFNGEVYNYIDFDAERTVTDILYFGTALSGEES